MDSVQSLRERQVSILCSDRSLKTKLYTEFINESSGSVQIICHRELETIIENVSIKDNEQLYVILFEDQVKYVQKLLLKFSKVHIFEYSINFCKLIQKLHAAMSCQQYIDQAYQQEVLKTVQQHSGSEIDTELFSLTAKAKEVFTETESIVLSLMIEGCSIKEIAEKIYLSPYTVTGYVEAIKRKLKVSSKLQLINRMFKNGYVNRG
ncbi:response regulator transcription factor [Alkalihalobacillus sp. 1P02AB]|uniref:response regulator transcription factor n=1 Tax=Alkalihalobacillus sp. 1P02AB TaxID=3132260 RepID=UPI0039A555DD